MQNNSDFHKSEMLEVSCSCNEQGYVFLKDLFEDYYTVCKKCGKKIYGVNCSKCKSGFAFPEGDKSIDTSEKFWKCGACGQKNAISAISESNLVRSYSSDEIPENVKKTKMGNTLWGALSIKGKIILAVFFIFIFILLQIIT